MAIKGYALLTLYVCVLCKCVWYVCAYVNTDMVQPPVTLVDDNICTGDIEMHINKGTAFTLIVTQDKLK